MTRHTPTVTPGELVNVWSAYDDACLNRGNRDADRSNPSRERAVAFIRAIDGLVGCRDADRFRDLLTRHREGGRVHHHIACTRALEELARIKAELLTGVAA